MSTSDDLDEATARAWRQLKKDVARRINQLEPGEAVLLQLDAPEREEYPCSPYVQVLWTERGPLAEVSSNHYLHDRYRLDKAGRRALGSAGWQRPNRHTRNYWRRLDTTDQAEAAVAAALMVEALRDVFGVVHPAFLVDFGSLVPDDAARRQTRRLVAADLFDGGEGTDAGDGDGPDPLDDLDAALADLSSLADELERYAAPAVRPADPDHLRLMVEKVVADVLGHQPEHDADGDIPIVCGRSLLYVRIVDGDLPVVRIFGDLVVGVTEPERASYEVNVLNRDVACATFILIGDSIALRSDVLASPFAPEHLRVQLQAVCAVAAKSAPDLAFRTGGRCLLDAEDEVG